jgi:HlyD family secretion protein
MKRTILYVILGLVLIGAVAGGIVWQSGQAMQAEQDLRTAVAERGDMLVAVSASGNVEPEARVNLAFEATGPVDEVLVRVGERVEADDVLARIDTDQLELQVHQAEASLMLARSQLAQLEEGPQPEEVASAEANLRAAQSQLGGAAAERDQVQSGATAAQIAAAEARVASAEVQKKVAQDAYDQSEDDEDDRYDLYVAEEALKAAQAELDELLAGADTDLVRAAEANVWALAAQRDAAQAQLDLVLAGATEEQIADAEAQVDQAEAALELAELAVERATLRAPFDGRVAQVNVAEGEVPTAGPAVVLVDPSQFHLTVSVDEIDVGRLAQGQTAWVTLDALPEEQFEGTVSRIAPAARFEGGVVYYDVRIDLEPTDAPVRADMTANATVVVEELTDVLRIPTWVVRVDRETGQTYVERRALNGPQRVDVELGVRYEGMAQVLSGLEEGDVLVLRPDEAFGFENR